MSDITLESIVRRSSDVMASQVENELVMMDIERGMYYALNPVGADIWERLAEPQQVADLCAQLQQEYAVDRATCEADVLAVLNDMAENGRWRRERVDSPKEVNISIFITQTEGTAKANDSSSVHVQNSRFDKEIRAGVHSAP